MDHLAFAPPFQEFFAKGPGVEPYRLLEALVKELPSGSKVVDLCTLVGATALSLATNPEVVVTTYDIVDHIPPNARSINDLPNITRVITDGVNAVPNYLDASLIVMDVNPHDGIQEQTCLDALRQHGYSGVVVCDDILLNDAMKAFWAGITDPKVDATAVGHWSGTGIVALGMTSVPDWVTKAMASFAPNEATPAVVEEVTPAVVEEVTPAVVEEAPAAVVEEVTPAVVVPKKTRKTPAAKKTPPAAVP